MWSSSKPHWRTSPPPTPPKHRLLQHRAAAAAAAAGTAGGAAGEGAAKAKGPKRLVAVTACPTGIAHTYMAADSLVAAAKEVGVDLQVETQGSSGAKALDPAVIAAADAVIFAVDVDVRGKERFAGMPVINAPVKRGIDEPDKMVAEALAAADNPHARRVPHFGAEEQAEHDAEEKGEHIGTKLKKALLTGVSYMIPFVAGGGLLIALGFLLGGYDITAFADKILAENSLFNLPTVYPALAWGPLGAFLGAVFFKIGALSLGFLVPALAGYIAYAIADRPGIAPGFVSGAVAVFMGAGFLGGIVGGLIAGYVAHAIGKLTVARWLRGLMPVVIIPLVASIAASGLLFVFLGRYVAAVTVGLNNWLSSLTGASAIALGIVLGLMMCFDLGGPVNKVAYSFAVAGLGAASIANQAPWQIMAAVMAAGMVPPLAMALAATVLNKKLFSLGGTGKRQGRLAAGSLVHLRRRHPVRRRRPAARHPRQHARRGRDRRHLDGGGRGVQGPARRNLRLLRDRSLPLVRHRHCGRYRRECLRSDRAQALGSQEAGWYGGNGSRSRLSHSPGRFSKQIFTADKHQS